MSGGSGVDHIQGQYPGPLSGERQLAEAGLEETLATISELLGVMQKSEVCA